MNHKPGVSVVIPTYNRVALLRETLKSVVSQTVMPAEVVVVDDGSTDNTPMVVREFEGAGPKIVFVARPHSNRRGPLRNAGVAASSSPFVAFLDSDDLWKPERLEVQLEEWSRSPEAGFAFCNAVLFNEEGVTSSPWLPSTPRWNANVLGDMLEEPLTGGSTLMVKREALEQVGGFRDLRTNEDYDLPLRLAARFTASYAPEPLVLIREHAGRSTLTWGEMPMIDYLRVVRGFLAENPQLPNNVRAHARRGMANVHYKLARLYLELGDQRAARRHLWSMTRLKPLDRRAPSSWLHALRSGGGKREYPNTPLPGEQQESGR